MSTLVAPHIELKDGPRGPRPRIAGRNVLVQAIVTWHHVLALSAEEIAAEYDLSLAEVYSALAYYFDHREELDAASREDEEFVAEMKRKNPSLLAEKLRNRFGA